MDLSVPARAGDQAGGLALAVALVLAKSSHVSCRSSQKSEVRNQKSEIRSFPAVRMLAVHGRAESVSQGILVKEVSCFGQLENAIDHGRSRVVLICDGE